MNKHQILIVEDDIMVSNLMATTLEMGGYVYRTAKNGSEAIMEALSYKPDIMLLDLGLPDMSGVDIIRKVREWSNMPIIVVSARVETSDKVSALDAGADDYLTKPFSVDELLARIRVALRRVDADREKASAATSIYENGSLRIDYAAGCTYMDGKEIHLTPMEYKLLCLLAKNTGKVLSYNYILKEIWGGVNESDMASLRVFMTVLRRKIEGSSVDDTRYIQTHVGIGYRMLSHNS
ncbi:MAG: response regulator transcription factor [Clostridiales bacterium]|nr:response regulator transcription factor [Candidatus Crickella merdequi]